jgi:hypothetical protein
MPPQPLPISDYLSGSTVGGLHDTRLQGWLQHLVGDKKGGTTRSQDRCIQRWIAIKSDRWRHLLCFCQSRQGPPHRY